MPTLTFNRPTRLNAWAFEIGDRYFDLARTDPDAPKHRNLTMLQVYVNGRVVHMTHTRMAANARAVRRLSRKDRRRSCAPIL